MATNSELEAQIVDKQQAISALKASSIAPLHADCMKVFGDYDPS